MSTLAETFMRGWGNKQRGRATVWTAVFALLLLNAGFIAVIQRRPAFRDPLYSSKEDVLAKQFIADVPGRVTVVAIGSSRTANAFHPPSVETVVTEATGKPCFAFNDAVLGRGPIFQLLHVRRLIARGIKPDVLVLEIVPSQFAAHGGKPSEIGHIRPDRLTWEEVEALAELGYSDAKYRDEWLESMLNPWFAFRFQLLGMIQPKWTPPEVIAETRKFPNKTGWQPYEERLTPEKHVKQLESAKSGHFENLNKMELGHAAVAALRETLALCKREGILAVVVLTAENSDFRSWYGPAALRAVEELIQISKHGADGRVIDARAWMPDAAFADGHHMYDLAAPSYTSRLTRELILPALRERSPR